MLAARALALLTALALPSAAVAAPSLAARTYHEEGTRLLDAKRYDEAVKALTRAVRFSTDFAEAWVDLGRAHLALKRYGDAAKSFQGALIARPDLLDARYNLALAHKKAGNFDKAAEAYRGYLQQRPDDADAYYALAETLRTGGDGKAAADAYDRYAELEKDPNRSRWIEHAKAEAARLRGGAAPITKPAPTATSLAMATPPVTAPSPTTTKAMPAARPAAAAAPLVATAPSRTAASAAMAPPPNAQKTRVRPAAFGMGIASLNRRDFPAALSQLKNAVAASPNDPLVIAALASAHLGMGDGASAAEAYRRASTNAPPTALPGIRLGLAESLRTQGDDGEAAVIFRAMLADPTTPADLRDLAAERLEHL